MPSETKPPGFSPSSFFSDEIFSDERQVGARKADHSYSGLKMHGLLRTEGISSSHLGNRLAPNSEYYMDRGRNAPISVGKHAVRTEIEASHSLPTAAFPDRGARSNQDMDSASYFLDGNKVNLMGTHHENSLFSSSLSDILNRNLRLSFNSSHAPQHDEEDAFGSLEELEARTIGNLLPSDDDDLFSRVNDGLENTVRHHIVENMEDLDLFSSVGGLELGEDGFSRGNVEMSDINSINQQRPSRTLFVRNINSEVEDAELRILFEQFGDIWALHTAYKHRGFVIVSYFDIRAACNAMKALPNKPLRHMKLDVHFTTTKDNPSASDTSQGTLTVSNLDSGVSNDELVKIFSVYGEIREIREASNRPSHKVVEYYDVRAAESALHALKKFDIAGHQIKIEPGQPASTRSRRPFSLELEQDKSGFMLQQHSLPSNLETAFPGPLLLRGTASMNDNGLIIGPRSINGSVMSPILDNTINHGLSSSIPNRLSSLARGEAGKSQPFITESGHLRNHPMFELQGSPSLHPHSLPEYHSGLANGLPFGSSSALAANVRAKELIDGQQFRRVGSNVQSVEFNEGFGSSGNRSSPSSGLHYMWNNLHHPQAHQMLWPGSPSLVNGIGAHHPQKLSSVPRALSHMLNPPLTSNDHHMGSAPSLNQSMWERLHSYTGDTADATAVFRRGSLGNVRMSGNNSPLEFVNPNMFPRAGGNCMDVPISSKSMALHPHNQRGLLFPARGQMLPVMTSFGSPNDRSRNRRNEGSCLNQTDNKKQFELDVDRILRGEDKRTTLMIKNIPNKYTSKMLLVAIDERHKGTYDFIYLPIDFKNKCNVGYAFINMADPSLIVPFYETFNGKKWEKFNSEKVASLAYARIQGKSALIAHFQNSSLMNEDKRCRPILFHTDGPNAGDQVPFPLGNNIRPRPGKVRASTSDENNQELLINSSTVEGFPNGGSTMGKDLD